MDDLLIRAMSGRELAALRDIDRSERVTVGYRVVQGELQAGPVELGHPDLPGRGERPAHRGSADQLSARDTFAQAPWPSARSTPGGSRA